MQYMNKEKIIIHAYVWELLAALKSIIDVASQRGAFKPNEMVAVGQTYQKLDTFLTAVASQQQQAPAA